jgi:hypothetical protein
MNTSFPLSLKRRRRLRNKNQTLTYRKLVKKFLAICQRLKTFRVFIWKWIGSFPGVGGMLCRLVTV